MSGAAWLSQLDDAHSVIGWLSGLSGTAVMVLVGWLVGTGRLILKRELEREQRATAAALTELAEWKRMALRTSETTSRSQNIADKAIEIAVTAQSSQQGPAGAAGPQGIQGPPGPRG